MRLPINNLVNITQSQRFYLSLWIWRVIFITDAPCPELAWVDWANEQFFASESPPVNEWWLCDFLLAKDFKAVINIINENLAEVEHDGIWVNDEPLIIGLLVERHIWGDLTIEQLWRSMDKLTDIAMFLARVAAISVSVIAGMAQYLYKFF